MKVLHKRHLLEEKGYSRFHLAEEITDLDVDLYLKALEKEFENLPIDPYAVNKNRYRRYSRAIIMPWSKKIEWLPNYHLNGTPVCEYFQGRFNREYLEDYRAFAPLSDAVKANPLLHRIIQYDFEMTFWDDRELILPIHVGVHFVKMLAETDQDQSVASPDHIHQDGEPFTFVHLIARRNVAGGINTIATTECAGKRREEVDEQLIIEEFELKEPLESYGVCDKMVSHYVSAVKKGPDAVPGERSAILIDYTPLITCLN
ncbi:2OG-Fe dioxygenase family protein [Thermoflavimicrobium dichotomicum]|uniref:2OG-Fe dioxygenase n=1 Tax=Thermoflavimicrobium dichotomicum TaxID=46223 RepID=A0A1I3SKS9_9BACL|nr:2OG-Fe dioxygenase family protein [Thermoflavimicrobium dichotomicum]SFJ59335.1 hypothetical protein SAMN05421852_11388 [Thermoflavimicrobium dichotomicum]